MPVLELQNLTKTFGGLIAANDVNLSVERGMVHGLIGPNGAGKTTLFSLITGFYTPDRGKIIFDGTDVTMLSTSRRARIGLVRTFQSNLLFSEDTVLENVRKGSLAKDRRHALDWITQRRGWHDEAERNTRSILAFCGLGDKMSVRARELSHGLQRQLGIAIALATKPEVLLLDEPFTGMTGGEKNNLMSMIQAIRKGGTTIVLVEHDMRAVMRLCDRITVLNFGKVLTEGDPDHVRKHPEVIAAYLGTG